MSVREGKPFFLSWRGWLGPVLLAIAGLSAVGMLTVVAMMQIDSAVDNAPPTSKFGKERALCDRAVEALLNSQDLVEVTRAGTIVTYLNCSISRRLP